MFTCKYSATLEFNQSEPETIRGEVTAASFPSLYRNAAKELRRAFPNRKWDSAVIVMLERMESPK